jgi:hypothetical protein
VTCANCKCARCFGVRVKRDSSRLAKDRAAFLWLHRFARISVKDIATALGVTPQSLGGPIGAHGKSVLLRAAIPEGTSLAELEPHEQRLYMARAIPIAGRGGSVSAGDYNWPRWKFWDTEEPPDDWLTRHKQRDPRVLSKEES